MFGFLKSISKVFSSLGGSTGRPKPSLPSLPTAVTSANPSISSAAPPSSSVPIVPPKVVDAMTPEALIIARRKDIENIKSASKDWTASQLRQMFDHGIKARGKKNWSGIIVGKTGVECRQAWAESMSTKLRKALHNRPKKSK